MRLLGIVSATPVAPDQVHLFAEQVANVDPFFTSGTLRIEYWFFPSPYDGSVQFGYLTAQTRLRQLSSGFSFFNVSRTVPLVLPPNGFYCPAFILTEFNGIDFAPIDFVNFSCRSLGDPSNSPPVAFFTASPTSGDAPLTVALDASGSSDADGVIVGYGWGSSDGQTRSGVTTSLTFTEPGSYVITLAVVDDDGELGFFERTVTVSAPDPCPGRSQIGPSSVLVGSLTASDCLVTASDGSFYLDVYDIVVPADGRLTVGMSSAEIDSLVAVVTADLSQIVAKDDDGGGGLDALLSTDLDAGSYVIFASSSNPLETGSYTLTTSFVPEPRAALLQTGAFGAVAGLVAARRRRRASRARRQGRPVTTLRSPAV